MQTENIYTQASKFVLPNDRSDFLLCLKRIDLITKANRTLFIDEDDTKQYSQEKKQLLCLLNSPNKFFKKIAQPSNNNINIEQCVISKENQYAYHIYPVLPTKYWQDEDVPFEYLNSAKIFYKNELATLSKDAESEAIKFGFKNGIRREHLNALYLLYNKQCNLLHTIRITPPYYDISALAEEFYGTISQMDTLEKMPLLFYPYDKSKQIYHKLKKQVYDANNIKMNLELTK